MTRSSAGSSAPRSRLSARGWAGRISGQQERAISASTGSSASSTAGSSTFAGRCRVTRPYRPGSRPSLARVPLAGPSGVHEQRVDHDVADEVDLRLRVSLGPQVGRRVVRRGEQVVADPVGDDPVDLLGHRPVAAAQAGLDMGGRRPQLRGDQGACQCRVHIANHDHIVRGPGRPPAARTPSSPGRSARRGCPSPRRGSNRGGGCRDRRRTRRSSPGRSAGWCARG